jgi:hypothetical protein
MDLAMELRENLNNDFCKKIIERFEKDDRKHRGETGGGFNPEMKNSLDLQFSRFVEWDDVSKELDEKLKENLHAYQEFLNERFPNFYRITDTWHSGYQMQKSGYYRWHHDSRIEYGRERILTFIWYMNTIEEGGQTGFHYKSVKPETGKFVFFPSTWDYVHCGFDATDKYIITGWMWREVNPL